MDNSTRQRIISKYLGWILFDCAFAPYVALGIKYQPLIIEQNAKNYLASISPLINWYTFEGNVKTLCGSSKSQPPVRPINMSLDCHWEPSIKTIEILGQQVMQSSLPSQINSIALLLFLIFAVFLIPLTENTRIKRMVIISTSVIESIAISCFLFCRMQQMNTNQVFPAILSFIIIISSDLCKISYISYLPCLINKKQPDDNKQIPILSTYADTLSQTLSFLFWPMIWLMDKQNVSDELIQIVSFGVMGGFSFLLSIISFQYLENIDDEILTFNKVMQIQAGQFGMIKKIFKSLNLFLQLITFLLYKDFILQFSILFQTASKTLYGVNSMDILNSTLIVSIGVIFSNSILIYIVEKFQLQPKQVLMVILTLFASLGVQCYKFNQNIHQFYIITMMTGLIIGGYSSFQRALQMQILPKGQETRFLGFLSIMGFGSGYLAPLLTGIVNDRFNDLQLTQVQVFLPFLLLTVMLLGVQDHEWLIKNKDTVMDHQMSLDLEYCSDYEKLKMVNSE